MLGLIVYLFFVLAPLASAQVDYCEGNFDYDRDQDGTDAFTFKTDFGRSSIVNPCPLDGPAPVGKTGQTLCYDETGTPRDCSGTGEDAEYQKGVVSPGPRFTDNDNGTVTDNLTGLIWLKNANCFGTRAWAQALTNTKGLASGSCDLTDGSIAGDWRLPNKFELESLLDLGQYNPALPLGHPFTNVSTPCWSSTTYAGSAGSAFLVNFYSGGVDAYDKSSYQNGYVWPVRGGH
jgi:hypothetical protein